MLGQLGGAPLCPCCDKRVYFNEEKNFAGKKWHKSCFTCSMNFLNFILFEDFFCAIGVYVLAGYFRNTTYLFPYCRIEQFNVCCWNCYPLVLILPQCIMLHRCILHLIAVMNTCQCTSNYRTNNASANCSISGSTDVLHFD